MKKSAEVLLLERAIAASKRGAPAFAREILFRDRSTVRRYLAGEIPMPAPVIEALQRMVKPGYRFPSTESRPRGRPAQEK